MKDNILFFKALKDLEGKKGTESIREQARLWDIYAKTSPILFVAVMGLLWMFDAIHHHHILIAGAILFSITAVTWWFWTVHTIGKIAQLLRNADDGVQETLHDLRDIKDLVKKLRD